MFTLSCKNKVISFQVRDTFTLVLVILMDPIIKARYPQTNFLSRSQRTETTTRMDEFRESSRLWPSDDTQLSNFVSEPIRQEETAECFYLNRISCIQTQYIVEGDLELLTLPSLLPGSRITGVYHCAGCHAQGLPLMPILFLIAIDWVRVRPNFISLSFVANDYFSFRL